MYSAFEKALRITGYEFGATRNLSSRHQIYPSLMPSVRSCFSQVTVIVNDINDNNPQFVNTPQSTQISEAARPGSNVIQVSALDIDLGFAGKVVYNITDGDPDGERPCTQLSFPRFTTEFLFKRV